MQNRKLLLYIMGEDMSNAAKLSRNLSRVNKGFDQ